MAINITSILFQDDYTGTYTLGTDTGVPFLMGNIGDFMYVTIDAEIGWSVLNKEMTFVSSSSTITITNGTSWIDAGFKVGDTIIVNGTANNNSSFTIIAISLNILTTLESLTDETASSTNVYGITPIQSIDLYYNLVGNNDQITYISLTDIESFQKYSGDITSIYSGSYTLQQNSTSLAWQTLEVDGIDCSPVLTTSGYSDDYKQLISIVFPFLITPFTQPGQLQLIQNAYAQSIGVNPNNTNLIPPRYFFQQCLKFIYQIDAKFSLTNPIADHSSNPLTIFSNGNSAWFNGFFPTGTIFNGSLITKKQYNFISITYSDALTNVISSFDYNQVSSVEMVIEKINGNWNSEDDLIVLNFCWIPNNSANIQGYSQQNQINFRRSYLHDRCRTVVNALPTNGDQFGLDTQVITNLSTTISGATLTINFDVDLGSYCKSVFSENNKDFMFWVSPETIIVEEESIITTLNTCDRSALLCDVNETFTNTDDDKLFEIITAGSDNVLFLNETPSAAQCTDIRGMIGTYNRAKCDFKVKDNCTINSINLSFECNVNGMTFPIEQWNNRTSDFWDGVGTQIQINEYAGFDIKQDSPFQIRSINRLPASDGGGYIAYRLYYSFQLGYKFWDNINNFPPEVLFWHNQYWAAYTQGLIGKAGNGIDGDVLFPKINISFKIEWNITDNTTGIETQFIRYCETNVFDQYGNIGDFISGSNKTFDLNGNDLNGTILNNGKTLVQATFSTSTTIIGTKDLDGILYFYYENGEISKLDRISINDLVPETINSVWLQPPTVTYGDYDVVVYGIIDTSILQLAPKNIRLYSKLNY